MDTEHKNLTQGLGNSCNPFFITIGRKLGVHNYFKYFDGFGFTERTGIDLPVRRLRSITRKNSTELLSFPQLLSDRQTM